jgi:hypothetical protein
VVVGVAAPPAVPALAVAVLVEAGVTPAVFCVRLSDAL